MTFFYNHINFEILYIIMFYICIRNRIFLFWPFITFLLLNCLKYHFYNTSIPANKTWIYNTSTARQYHFEGFEISPSVALLPEDRIRKGVKQCSHHSLLASPFVRRTRTVPREWCRLRESVGPFNFPNRKRATRRRTSGMIVGNMRETFNFLLPSFSFFFFSLSLSSFSFFPFSYSK